MKGEIGARGRAGSGVALKVARGDGFRYCDVQMGPRWCGEGCERAGGCEVYQAGGSRVVRRTGVWLEREGSDGFKCCDVQVSLRWCGEGCEV